MASNIYLCNGFKAKGDVRLLGAQIGGNLLCDGGNFRSDEGVALSIECMNVAGSVYLGYGFKANGSVHLTDAKIGNNLRCDFGHFEVNKGSAIYGDRMSVRGNVSVRFGFRAVGAVSLNNVQIEENFECNKGHFEARYGSALSLSSAVIKGTFLLKDLAKSVRINLSHSEVGVLNDDMAAWANESVLDGFRYGAIGGQARTNGKDRLGWLLKQPEKHLDSEEFRPQPWRQLQRVLREMGHTEDAKQVGIAFEDHLRKIDRMGKWPNDPCDLVRGFRGVVTRTAHYVFGKLAGYGYRPVNLVLWMFGVWLACAVAYWCLALPPYNAIAPSDPLIFQNKRYQDCRPDHHEEPGNWFLCETLRSEYATFSPLAYSLDVMLPVVDLGLEKTWGAYIPSPKKSWFDELFLHWKPGHFVRLITWFQILFGWVSSLLLVAIISGFSRRNDEG